MLVCQLLGHKDCRLITDLIRRPFECRQRRCNDTGKISTESNCQNRAIVWNTAPSLNESFNTSSGSQMADGNYRCQFGIFSKQIYSSFKAFFDTVHTNLTVSTRQAIFTNGAFIATKRTNGRADSVDAPRFW